MFLDKQNHLKVLRETEQFKVLREITIYVTNETEKF